MEMNQKEIEIEVMRVFNKQIAQKKKELKEYQEKAELEQKWGNDAGAEQYKRWAFEWEVEITALNLMQCKVEERFWEINNLNKN